MPQGSITKEQRALLDEINAKIKKYAKSLVFQRGDNAAYRKLAKEQIEYEHQDYEVTDIKVDPDDPNKVSAVLKPKFITLNFTITDKGAELSPAES